MNKKNQIDYTKVGAVLRTKATQDLQKAVGEDLKLPDPSKPMTMEEISAMQIPLGDGSKTDWSQNPPPTEAEIRQQEADEIDALDNELNSE